MPCACCGSWIEGEWLEWHGRQGSQFFVCEYCRASGRGATTGDALVEAMLASLDSWAGEHRPSDVERDVHASLFGHEPLAALDQAEDMRAAGVNVPMIVHHTILHMLHAIGIRKGVYRAIENYFNQDEATNLRQLCNNNPEIDRALSDFRQACREDREINHTVRGIQRIMSTADEQAIDRLRAHRALSDEESRRSRRRSAAR